MDRIVSPQQLHINRSFMSFFLPFSFDARKKPSIVTTLKEHGYHYFQLDEAERWKGIYGDNVHVQGKELEQYFYRYIEHKLFPRTLDDRGFHRFSIGLGSPFIFSIRNEKRRFIARSIDVILGPFGIGFITIRIETAEKGADLADILEFMQHFRSIDKKLDETRGSHIIAESGDELSIYDFLIGFICPFLQSYMITEEKLEGYFGALPYFDDERMYASAFLFAEEGSAITEEQLFRMGHLNGRNAAGEVFVSSHNPQYIRKSLAETLHDRWAPDTYTVVTDHAYVNVTTLPEEEMANELTQYMGTHYYNFLLHYFYRIMLLRVSFEYSEIEWKKDEQFVKSLIKLITLFSSWYYYREISTRSEGKEFSELFYRAFNIQALYAEVNQTLGELYKNQENSAQGRSNMLLFILTVFTVISGIYGMNLVIEDWDDPLGWRKFTSYNFFEWISLITAVSGISLSTYLVVSLFLKWMLRRRRDRKSELYM